MELTFNQNESVKAIDEETFLMTRDYQERKLGVGNLTAYKDVVDAISQAGFTPELQDIYIQKRAISKPSAREVAREGYFSEWDPKGLILNKYVLRVGYTKKGMKLSDGYSPSIAISFNQDRIEVAQGLNIHVCSNMNILSKERHVQSWGKGSPDWDGMIAKVIEWMSDAIMHYKNDVERIVRLQAITIDDPKYILEDITGKLHVMVESDLFYKQNEQILNHGVTNEFVRRMINLINDVEFRPQGRLTAYDFYQEMTDASSHQAEISQRILSTWKVFDFIDKYFVVDEVFDTKRQEEIIAEAETVEVEKPAKKKADKKSSKENINTVGSRPATSEEEAQHRKDFPEAYGDVPPNVDKETGEIKDDDMKMEFDI